MSTESQIQENNPDLVKSEVEILLEEWNCNDNDGTKNNGLDSKLYKLVENSDVKSSKDVREYGNDNDVTDCEDLDLEEHPQICHVDASENLKVPPVQEYGNDNDATDCEDLDLEEHPQICHVNASENLKVLPVQECGSDDVTDCEDLDLEEHPQICHVDSSEDLKVPPVQERGNDYDVTNCEDLDIKEHPQCLPVENSENLEIAPIPTLEEPLQSYPMDGTKFKVIDITLKPDATRNLECPSSSKPKRTCQNRISKKKAQTALTQSCDDSDNNEDFEDSGSEYEPNSRNGSLQDDDDDISDDEIRPQNTPVLPAMTETAASDEIEGSLKKKSRKRVRDEKNWKRNIRKLKRAKGEEYINEKGNTIPAKKPCSDGVIICSCANKCSEKINSELRTLHFNNFYKLANTDLQNSYLFSLLTINNKARSYTKAEQSRRQRTILYFIPESDGKNVRVCKQFFLKTFQVSDGRVTRLVQYKASNQIIPLDQRGKDIPANKTSTEKIEKVKAFINNFPAYESHYTREKSEKKYLAPDLNISIMHKLYKESHENPVSEYIFRQVFNTEFNLSFHAPISDSCKKCDLFNNKMKHETDDTIKATLKQEYELHLRKAEAARDGKKQDTKIAKERNDISVITFDLMKTLPTPVISTGVCYYKRQLWTYCLGIHDLVTDDVKMYVWNESIGSRGPQEIGSCILHYIKHFVTTPKLIMYSDQCGGQNRNIKMSVLCQYIVSNEDYSVNKIDHKFLVSGHSYLSCDQDFGLIEKQKKYFKDIFVPQDWNRVIAAARKRKPFKVIEVDSSMIFSTKKLETNITNRKININRGKMEWLKIQWLKFSKETPFKINYKYSNNEEVTFETVDLKKRQSTKITELDLLYPNGNAITEAKKKTS